MKRALALAILMVCLTPTAAFARGGDDLNAGIVKYGHRNPEHLAGKKLRHQENLLRDACKSMTRSELGFLVANAKDGDSDAKLLVRDMRIACPKTVAKAG